MNAPLLTSAELLVELNRGRSADQQISRTLLHTWVTTRPKWRACLVEMSRRKRWFSRQKLIDIGVLMREPTVQVIAGPTFQYVTKAV